MTTVAGNRGGASYLYEEGELIPVENLSVDKTWPEQRVCTCHPAERPEPCPGKHALNECRAATQQRQDEPGLRYDAGKARYDLLPADALQCLVAVYTVGAAKYADRNWEKGMSWSRCFGSLMRHCWAFWRGETIDKESGCHHMAHAAWNALALVTYDCRGIGTDDRPKL